MNANRWLCVLLAALAVAYAVDLLHASRLITASYVPVVLFTAWAIRRCGNVSKLSHTAGPMLGIAFFQTLVVYGNIGFGESMVIGLPAILGITTSMVIHYFTSIRPAAAGG